MPAKFHLFIISRVRLIASLSCFLVFSLLRAQTLPIVQGKSDSLGFEQAGLLYKQGQYQEAQLIFQQLLLKDPNNANLNFLMGDCLMQSVENQNEAMPFLEKAVKNITTEYSLTFDQRKAPVVAFEKLGDVYCSDYRFEDAVTKYKVFKTYMEVTKDKGVLDRITGKIEAAEYARTLLNNPLKMTLAELPFINVISFLDEGAVMSEKGSIIYFSRRRAGISGPNGTSDIYYMRKTDGKWERPVRMPFVNSDADDNICWVSGDGNRMLISSDKEGNFDLYLAERIGKSQWTAPLPAGAAINSKSSETSAWMSEDGKMLYFSSDRKGGMGGMDIYEVVKGTDGNWSVPQNLGVNVNTQEDEKTPFLAPDKNRLYFSSNGYKGMGGFDVFYITQINPSSWSLPVNAGYPVNTTGDDIRFVITFQGNPDYFVSRSRSGKAEYSVCPLNDSEAQTNVSEVKGKEVPKEKPRLKLVPKTLKY